MVARPILDETVSVGFRGGPGFVTPKLITTSGMERRRQVRTRAKHSYRWSNMNRSDADIATLKAFFMDRRGDLLVWLLKDWTDYKATDENFGTGDGVTGTFQLRKTYGTDNPYVRLMTAIKAGTLTVYEDGVEKSVTEEDGFVSFAVPPADLAPLTATYEFYVPVRFDGDQLIASRTYPEPLGLLDVEGLMAMELLDE